METLMLTVHVVISVLNDCIRTGRELETVGVMMGPKEISGVVTHVIPSSEHAERGRATCYQSAEDVEILNDDLARFQEAGFDFKGYYHRHPKGYRKLSPGDRDTCKGILTSPDYKINNELLMLIITETEDVHELPIFAYKVSLNRWKRVVVKELSIKILPERCAEELFIDCISAVE